MICYDILWYLTHPSETSKWTRTHFAWPCDLFERPSISPSCWISSDFAMAKKKTCVEQACTNLIQLVSNTFLAFLIICCFFCYQQVGLHSGYPWADSFQQRRVCPEWIYDIYDLHFHVLEIPAVSQSARLLCFCWILWQVPCGCSCTPPKRWHLACASLWG